MGAPVFRHWDQDELNRQVSARGTVPDIAPFMDDYARLSAEARSNLQCRLDVPYGPTEPERLDIFPARKPNSPIFVFIHGGYWRMLDARDSSFMAKTFVEAGCAVVAINYALAPSVSLHEIVRQCRAALRFTVEHAAEFNGDAARIHVCGSSAGGHLTGMMIARGWAEEFGLKEGFIQSASLLSGLMDLEPVRLSNCNEWCKLDAAGAKALSPIEQLPAKPLPLVIAYGTSETTEFLRQSECYAAACKALGSQVEIVCEPNSNHFDLPLRLSDRTAPLTQALLKIIKLS
jgi:arylformamidase